MLLAGCAALAWPGGILAQDDIPHVRILFLGNNDIAQNRLPATVGELLLSSKMLAPHVGSYLQEGHNLDRHSQDAAGLELLKQGADGKPWDVVVVQEHSVFSAAAAVHEEARILMNQGLSKLVAAARSQNPQVLVVVLQIWTRSETLWQKGDKEALRTGPSLQQARQNIHRGNALAVQAALKDNPGAQILICPVGDLWSLVLESYPAMPLYQENGIHPDKLGTLLAGLALTGTIGGREVMEKATWLGDLPFSQVARVKKVLLDHPEVFKDAAK